MSLLKPPLSDDLSKLLYGLTVGGEAIAFEYLNVSDDKLYTIPQKPDAVYCRIMLEADAGSTNSSKAIRFLQSPVINNELATADDVKAYGFPMADKGVITVSGSLNMANFKCIGVEPNLNHTLLIEYYG